MFAVLIAGSIGYVLSGWVGVAVGATVASAVAVLTEGLTPPIERGTSHERRMRKDRRYRARYEAIEDSWRRPYPRSRREWQRATQPAGTKPAVADPVPAQLPSPVPAANTQEQLPASSKRPGRGARAETSSRTSAGPSTSGKSDSKPARRSETGRQKRAVKASPQLRGGTPPA